MAAERFDQSKQKGRYMMMLVLTCSHYLVLVDMIGAADKATLHKPPCGIWMIVGHHHSVGQQRHSKKFKKDASPRKKTKECTLKNFS